jgi:hypothetical protein
MCILDKVEMIKLKPQLNKNCSAQGHVVISKQRGDKNTALGTGAGRL